ncbi:MAG: cob(I)yrinic acid a,c-diamide adenosyltransferase [Patescibacteria group bacterium]|jgi:cob(I)alamin adenosyltransferase
MYFTGKGDNGTSTVFNSEERLPKNDPVFELLGALDELNSWLGFCVVEAKDQENIQKILKNIQHDLFICQAHFAQADILIPQDILEKTENCINNIAADIKKRESFVLSGGSKLSAILDVARTLVRRVERSSIGIEGEHKKKIDQLVFAYLNRLSSLLYVLARQANDLYGVEEENPNYDKYE